MKPFATLLILVSLVLPLAGQNYVDQAIHWQRVQRTILASDSAARLDPIRFEHYLDALRSEAECHYMLDNYQSLQRCAESYWTLLQQRDDLDDDVRENLLSYGYKVLGSYSYGQSDDDSAFCQARQMYNLALLHADPYDYRHRCVLHREMAQLLYRKATQKDSVALYGEAYRQLQFADDALAHSTAPFNSDTLRALLLSEKAITLARLAESSNDSLLSPSRLKAAIDTADLALRLFPAGSEMRFEMLRKKAKILMLTAESIQSLAHDGVNPSADQNTLIAEAANIYRLYFNHQKTLLPKRLAGLRQLQTDPTALQQIRENHWLTIRRLLTDCCRLEGHDPKLLYDVALFSKLLLQEMPLSQTKLPAAPTWSDVQRKLGKNDCAIEFVSYEKYGRHHLAAITLHSTGQPAFVYLYPIDEILATNMQQYYLDELLATDNSSLKNIIYTDSILPSIIWPSQLLQAIDTLHTKRIYFAPDAFLHRLAIEYLWPSSNPPSLYRVTSTRQLAQTRSSRGAMSPMLLMGHIDYNHNSVTPSIPKQANDTVTHHFFKAFNLTFDSLPGTREELDSIGSILSDTPALTILTDTAANEYAFRRMAPGNKIIHIATHGYCAAFISPETDLKPHESDIAMSLSALALAGANRIDTLTSHYDGILSANEISQLSLSDVQIVVLSACQSAEGLLTDDGLFGLQRGLKNAGVKALIVSLWNVDDEATAMLMSLLYKHMKNHDPHTAFLMARKELMELQAPQSHFDPRLFRSVTTIGPQFKPQHYNAFIMIDLL